MHWKWRDSKRRQGKPLSHIPGASERPKPSTITIAREAVSLENSSREAAQRVAELGEIADELAGAACAIRQHADRLLSEFRTLDRRLGDVLWTP